MRAVDVIIRKRDGRALSRAAIDAFVSGVTTGAWPDYQASALLMAIFFQGMDPEEVCWLTDAMVRSGDSIDLTGIPGVTVGKHSTGGVGDKLSIVVAPLVAACGAVVPKISGRGLGHTGGTLDKLESIPGFRVGLSIDEFKAVLRQVGTCMIGPTASLVPADAKMYALRDVTGTVESVSLIASSIMSKKLAEGARALVLDVKCGDGAFMKNLERARALAEVMVSIGVRSGVRTEAVISDMSAPLGLAVGNSLEIIECLDVLRGEGPPDVAALACRLASRMLVVAGVHRLEPDASEAVAYALSSGKALERFRRMIEHQGGNPRVVDDPSRLPSATGTRSFHADRSGFVARVSAEAIGRASNVLGAGRDKVGESVDHGVGLVMRVKTGDRVAAGDTLLDLHHRDGRGVDAALALCQEACAIEDEATAPVPVILDEVR